MRTVIQIFITYYNKFKIYDIIKRLKSFLFSLLKRLLIGRFVLFILKSIFDYLLRLPIYNTLFLIMCFLVFIIYLIVKFNVKSRIKNVYKDLRELYKQNRVLCILFLIIAYIISQALFLLLHGILSPFENIYFVSILLSVLKTSLLSFIDISPNNTICYMNSEGSSNSAQVGSSGSNATTDQEIQNFDLLKRNTAAKLRNMYINRPSNLRMQMSDPEYKDIINRLDHNVVCKAIFDSKSHLWKYLDDSTGEMKYTGNITLELLYIFRKLIFYFNVVYYFTCQV